MSEFNPHLSAPDSNAGRVTPRLFGPKLRALRLEARTTLQRLGRLVGVSTTYLQHLETGKRTTPPLGRLRQIAQALSAVPDPSNTLYELLIAAVLDRGEYSLPVPLDSSHARLHCTALLAMEWDHLTDEQLEQITQVVRGMPR